MDDEWVEKSEAILEDLYKQLGIMVTHPTEDKTRIEVVTDDVGGLCSSMEYIAIMLLDKLYKVHVPSEEHTDQAVDELYGHIHLITHKQYDYMRQFFNRTDTKYGTSMVN